MGVDVCAGFTWSVETEQHSAPLQRQAEAVAPGGTRVQQRPRVPQGLELQGDGQPGGRAQRGTQRVQQAAPPVEARHAGDCTHARSQRRMKQHST